MLTFSIVSITPPVHGQTVVQRISKRFFKKNKVKRTGKRLVGMGKAAPLDEMALDSDIEVIGFEPSWMIANGAWEDHYFNLLSTLVLGEYDINPTTGNTRSLSNFRVHLEKELRDKDAKQPLNIIETADYHNPKIKFLLQVTYYGDYGIEARQRGYIRNLITDPEVHQTFKDSIQAYLTELTEVYGLSEDRTGILIDFQIDKSFFNDDFVDFMEYLRTELGDDHLIYLKIPAKYRKDALISASTVLEMDAYVDKFIVQGYGFEKYSRDYASAVSIDKNTSYSINGTLMFYRLPGYEDIVDEKFIVELPYFGVVFKKDRNGNYYLREGSPYITIDNFNSDVKGKSGELKYENDNMVAYFNEGDSLIYVVEDSTSMVSKYHYLTDTLGLGGFAINAMGYWVRPEERRAESWAGIADEFGDRREKLGWVIAYYLTAFIPIGFVFSILRYWEVRNTLAKFSKYWNRFLIFFLLSFVIFMICRGWIDRIALVILGLIIMAVFIIYIFIKKAIMRSKKYVNLVK